MAQDYEWLLAAHGTGGEPQRLYELGRQLEADGRVHLAATAYDRAFGLRPDSAETASARAALLDGLAVRDHDITFRYVPAGTFLMGSDTGDPDEAPVHPVRVGAYWLSETPISWAAYCSILGWEPPPHGVPAAEADAEPRGGIGPEFYLHQENKIRLQYCEDATTRARDWHAHAVPPYEEQPAFDIEVRFVSDLANKTLSPELRSLLETEGLVTVPDRVTILDHGERVGGWEVRREGAIETLLYFRMERDVLAVYKSGIPTKFLFGNPRREDPRRPWQYDTKPMVSVSWHHAQELCEAMSCGEALYRLPTEAEWEKAARGGLIGRRYPWGDEPPGEDRCDYGRFDAFAIQRMFTFPPNGYGLFAMSGCVWEWTSDWYDAQCYAGSSPVDPTGPAEGKQKVLRGGSWADCAETATVSFRMSRHGSPWRAGTWGDHMTPNFGMRICRVARQPGG